MESAMENTEHLDLQAATMAGDVRDMILTHIRAMETPWSKLSEDQQRAKIEAAESASRNLVRQSVSLVANRGFAHMPVTLKDWTVKDGIQLKVSALDTVEEITKLAEHRSGSALLVFASTSAFLGARATAEPDKDQPDLPIEDGAAGMSLEGVTADLSGMDPDMRAKAEAEVLKRGGAIGAVGTRKVTTTEERVARRAAEAGSNALPQSEMPSAPAA